MDITVVVCTHNRSNYLSACLDSLLAQDFEKSRFEIIVVDNASTDDTAELCQQYLERGVKYIYDNIPGLSHARNSGWRAALGAIIGFMDDDSVADTGWLTSIWAAYASCVKNPDLVGGPVRLQWDNPPPSWLNSALCQPLGELDLGNDKRAIWRHETLFGGNGFYTRACLERHDGFDENLGHKKNSMLSGEETMIQTLIIRDNGVRLYSPDAIIYHRVTPDRMKPNWFRRRYFWGGVSDAVMSNKGVRAEDRVEAEPVSGQKNSRQLVRFVNNALASIGFASRNNRIRARIYMAYVFGFCLGRLRVLP